MAFEFLQNHSAKTINVQHDGTSRFFRVKCLGKCKDLNVRATQSGGDLDVMGGLETYPDVQNRTCLANCYKDDNCSSLNNNCDVTTSLSDHFYVTAYAFASYSGGKVTFESPNLLKVDPQ